MTECTSLPESLLEDLNLHIYEHPKRPLLWSQTSTLFKSIFWSRLQSRRFYVLTLIYNLTIALLLSFTYFQLAQNVDSRTRAISILAALLTMRVALLTLTITTTQDVFRVDRKTVLRNRHFRFGFPAWLVFTLRYLTSLPFRIALVLLISLIMYPIVHQTQLYIHIHIYI